MFALNEWLIIAIYILLAYCVIAVIIVYLLVLTVLSLSNLVTFHTCQLIYVGLQLRKQLRPSNTLSRPGYYLADLEAGLSPLPTITKTTDFLY